MLALRFWPHPKRLMSLNLVLGNRPPYPPTVPLARQDYTGESALSVAANKGHAAVVSALLAAGASPHHRSLDGETPLHAAALSGSAECVRLLLEAGADPDVQSDLLLSYDEMTRISGRNFRNPSELGEWFRRQPRTSRLLMMESASIIGGCTPVSLAIGVGKHDSAVLLLDALGCTGKAPLSKAKADLLQSLLSIASSTGSMAMVTMLLDRLQVCGAASWMALTDAPTLAPGRRAVAGAGSRSGKASRTATATRTGRRGGDGGNGDADGRSWDGNARAGSDMFDAPVELIAAEGRRAVQPTGRLQASLSSVHLPPAYQQPGRRDPDAGVGGDVDGEEGMTAIEMERERAARKARARAGRAQQAAEAAAQQAQLRLERRRQQQQEQRQQQLLAKKQMQKELQQKQQPAEARVAENAGVELQKYILQERQQLRKKLGLDQDAVGGTNGTTAPAAQPAASETNSGATAATGAPEFQCRCCLRDDALDLRVASAATSAGSSAAAGVLEGGSAAGFVQCQVDPEHGAVGPRQRRLVVCCSGGCQLDYHYPDCWRELEALMKAARPDYHGLKGPAGRSHAAGIPCWSPDCTGVVLSAAVIEGTAENPRFHKPLYTAPCTVQQQQQQQTCKRGKVHAGAILPSAIAAPVDATAQGGGLSRKADRQKHWQQQSWYEEYEEYDDEKAGGDESQEQEQAEHGVEHEEEGKVAEGPRAAELVDLSTVKLVPLNRRQALAGLELEVEAPMAANGSGTGGATATTLDDVEAAPLVEGGTGNSRARSKRGGGVKLALADLHMKADAAEGESAVDGTCNVRPEMQPPPSPPPPRPAGVNAWKDTPALPFAIRPVWERDASISDHPNDGKARAAASNDSEQTSYSHTQAGWSPAHQAAVGVMVSAQPAASGSTGAQRPQMTEEDFPSLIPVNPAEGERAACGAASDPIIRALQLLKVPGTDILTGHLLLEGPCLRHLYTVLFRGRSRIADAQLSAILDRYGGMTAFQSFENGAAVAVSYRSEDTASAVAAGLGAGDALGLLGPSSLAGAGGLEVSCLLEFPTDNALAREMGQAERAAGGFAGSDGRPEGKGLVDRRNLSAGAVPFVPAGRSATEVKAVVAPPSPPPGSAATPITAGDGIGPKTGAAAAGSHRTPTVAAGAQPHGIAPRAAQVPLTTTHGTANPSASLTTVSDVSSSMGNDNGDGVHGAISTAIKSQAPASGAGVREFKVENTWAAPAENGASWDDAFSPACPWSGGNLPPTAEVKNAGPAASRTVPAVPSLAAPTRVASASVPLAVAPRPILAAVAAPTRMGAASSAPKQGVAVTGAPMPMNTATAAQLPVAAGPWVMAPVVAAPVVSIPVAPVMTTAPKAATSSQPATATGPSVVPAPIRRMTLAGFHPNMLQRQPQPQPQLRYEVPEPVPVLMPDAPSGIIAPDSTPTSASSCSPETLTPGPSVTPQATAQRPWWGRPCWRPFHRPRRCPALIRRRLYSQAPTRQRYIALIRWRRRSTGEQEAQQLRPAGMTPPL
ncbi:hypothetical protein Vafri_1108 [Volvox africanus]|nr:hypothetical protein Vafri_1108 [Volvox africanus]